MVYHVIWRISPSCRTILWSRYWFARYWSGSGCRCCVGFDWKVWGKSWINRYIWESVYLTSIVRWANWTWNWCTWHYSTKPFPCLPLPSPPVANKTTLAKKLRGSYDFATDGKNLVVYWLDNKVITCATNYVTCNLVSAAQRWSKSAKKLVGVPMLKPFEDYNKHIGGVDLFDQFVSTYRVRIRSKRWWWPFFAWAVNVSMENAWNLFRTVKKQKNWYGRVPKRGFHDNSGIFWKK